MTTLLLRPDLGKKAYRLRCRFALPSFPSERSLEKAKYAAAEQFVSDMAKQGWCYLDRHGFKMTGPYSAIEVVQLPKRSQQERWHIPSADIMAGKRLGPIAHDGGYARSVPLLSESDKWEYELAAVFVHQTILTEYPDKHEEMQHA